MKEQELYNEYRKSDCKSFTDFLINKITELKKTYRKQRNKRIDELQKENKELKKENQKWKDGIALKDEEIWCIETDFNTFKSKAKELLKRWVELYKPKLEGYPITPIQEQTEQFLSEVEK